ncbi:gluconate 2-dehydrogenase subunit 3 family protein [Formosa sp. S-31]|uniref:gluconate 2-dehydrogenase subunit 3 family protein n=1 Tax=Formosa sp. S-31 TaxID=2790949 RepID=UPI003EBA7D11
MNRRELIKQMGLGLGYMSISPAILNVFQSCKQVDKGWKPEVIPLKLKGLTDVMVDFFLPITETPGGTDLNLTIFIDKLLLGAETLEMQNLFKAGAYAFKEKLERTCKLSIDKIEKMKINQILKNYCDLSETQTQIVFQNLDRPFNQVETQNREIYLVYHFITKVRYYALLGYFTSQDIVEDVQQINPNLGYYNACV